MSHFRSKSSRGLICSAAFILASGGCAQSTQPVTSPVIGLGLDLFGVITTIAGSTLRGSTNGEGSEASFDDPVGITYAAGNLYITDTYNNQIRVVNISSEIVSTLAGMATSGHVDGVGTAATFNGPAGITTDGVNYLYVADTENNSIRQVCINADCTYGNTITFAGSTGAASGDDDGFGTGATFFRPTGIVLVGVNLYVSDSGNNQIRQISLLTQQVTTLAGTGVSGNLNGAADVASFDTPMGITSDGTNLYVADAQNNMIREVVIATGVVTTLAGSGTAGSTDAIGTSASFWYPEGVVTDGTFVYVTDTQNNTIREVTIIDGAVITLAGLAGTTGFTNGTESAAVMNQPTSVTTDGISLYFTDTGNEVIRKVQ
jgi:hypothetical protein